MSDLPIARVAVDLPLAHLDRPFDYLVPAQMSAAARPGCRVKVPFAGQEVSGYLLQRLETSPHGGQLQPLRRVVSAEPVLRPEIARLAGLVAERYAGSRADVLRLAIPPRHARVEREPTSVLPSGAVPPAAPAKPDAGPWVDYSGGAAFLDRLAGGSNPRAVTTVLPATDWPQVLVSAAEAVLASGRGAILCLPDGRDVERVAAVFRSRPLAARQVTLTAELGPAARYRAFLALARKEVQIAIGTRAAAFAPVHDLGLVAIWDDGSDLYAEPRAPYPHAREVLGLRALDTGCACLLIGHARTTEAQLLVESGWARSLTAKRGRVRTQAPRVHVTGGLAGELGPARSARLPQQAFSVVRAALIDGPVLLQVPRAGYLPALSCARCRQPARCTRCFGPVMIAARENQATCRWCGLPARPWRCAHCDATRLRAPVIGSTRTAEELTAAFPSIPVRSSTGDQVIDGIAGTPALVVATPGAEPVASGGYAAAVLLDTWLALARPDLRTTEETLRRWLRAAALVRPGSERGQVVLVGDPRLAVVQALVRWDPAGFAARELAERSSARLPPAARLVTITGSPDALSQFLAAAELPDAAQVLGPVPVPVQPQSAPAQSTAESAAESVRAVVRAPLARSTALLAAVRAAQEVRSARKLPAVRVQVDPYQLG